METPTLAPRPGVLLGILVGVCRPVLQILTRFQTKKCFFSASDFRFHIYLSLLRLERKQTNSSNPFLFLSYSFRIVTINMFIHSCSSLENHTPFQTKMGKVYTHFQTKTVQKSYPMGRHITIYLI